MGRKKKPSQPDTLATPTPQPQRDEAAVARRGQRYSADVPDFGQVWLYALQPEQVPVVRQRLKAAGITSQAGVKCTAKNRALLAHIWRLGARHDHTQPPINEKTAKASLRFPGEEGVARVLLLDDRRIEQLAAEFLKFNEVWASA